jgi:hypothetical protein
MPYYMMSRGDFRADLAATAAAPAENGLKPYLYWKDVIQVGKYVHPVKGYRLDITPDRLQQHLKAFKEMQRNGVAVPIVLNHSEKAENNTGWVVDAKVEGDRLFMLHKFLGEQARDVALKNYVSLGIEPNYKDGHGRGYGEAVVHSALTPVPVVPGQGDFVPLSMSGGQTADQDIFVLAVENNNGGAPMALSAKQTEGLKRLFGTDAGSVTDANAVDKLIELNDELVSLSRETIGGLRTELSAAEQRIELTASNGGQERTVDPDMAEMLVESLDTRLEMCVNAGSISPATAKALRAEMIADEDGNIQLSMITKPSGAKASMARRVLDILLENKPMRLGSVATGSQRAKTLSRVEPDGKEESNIADTTKRMREMVDPGSKQA